MSTVSVCMRCNSSMRAIADACVMMQGSGFAISNCFWRLWITPTGFSTVGMLHPSAVQMKARLACTANHCMHCMLRSTVSSRSQRSLHAASEQTQYWCYF